VYEQKPLSLNAQKPTFATFNLRTKFAVSISTHYEDMKGDTKCRKWDGLGYLGSFMVTGNSTN